MESQQPHSHVTTVLAAFHFSGLLGLFVGWIVVTWGNIKTLLFLALLQIACVLLVVFGNGTVLNAFGAGLWGLCSCAGLIVIPAAIAGGRAGMGAFAGMYVILLLYERTQSLTSSFQIDFLFRHTDGSAVTYALFLCTPIAIGILFLLPVKATLFQGKPENRVTSLEPRRHSALAVFLLNLIPFYYIYFIYRIHGQAANFGDHRNLLSKKAALCIALLFPIALPIMTTALYDVLEHHGRRNSVKTHRKWLIMLLTLLFVPAFPIAGALIQSDLNKLAAQKAARAIS